MLRNEIIRLQSVIEEKTLEIKTLNDIVKRGLEQESIYQQDLDFFKAKFGLLLKALPFGSCITDYDGYIIHYIQKFQDKLFHQDDITGLSAYEVFDFIENNSLNIRKALSGFDSNEFFEKDGKTYQVFYYPIAKDKVNINRLYIIIVNISKLNSTYGFQALNNNNQDTKIQSTNDLNSGLLYLINEQKKNITHLQERYEKLHQCFIEYPSPLLIIDAKGNVTDINYAAISLSSQEFKGYIKFNSNLFDILTLVNLNDIIDKIKSCLNGEIIRFNYELQSGKNYFIVFTPYKIENIIHGMCVSGIEK